MQRKTEISVFRILALHLTGGKHAVCLLLEEDSREPVEVQRCEEAEQEERVFVEQDGT